MSGLSDQDVCVTCGCDGKGTTAERGCSCDTCHAQPGQFLGSISGSLLEAAEFAREVGADWNTRIRLRPRCRNFRGHSWDVLVPEPRART